MPDDETMIASLLRELEAFERAGDTENVRGVKHELARLGYKAKAPAKRATKATPAKETRKATTPKTSR